MAEFSLDSVMAWLIDWLVPILYVRDAVMLSFLVWVTSFTPYLTDGMAMLSSDPAAFCSSWTGSTKVTLLRSKLNSCDAMPLFIRASIVSACSKDLPALLSSV